MKVPFNYLPFEFEDNVKIFDRWKQLIQSTEFTLGQYMEEFENKFADYIGSKHCFGTNCGTDALILSLKSLGIGHGDEVVTVCNTFYATVGAIVAVGAKPVFVDSNHRYQIDPDLIKKAITKKTRAIMPVHWGGASPEIEKIIEIANNFQLEIIEDACMGIGAKINNKSPGTFGKLGAFSMHPLKSLNVMGDGGMVVTDDNHLASWIKKYRNHGMIDRDNIDLWGVNMRLQPLQAVVAYFGLNKIEEVIKIRNKNAKILDNELCKLAPYVKVPQRLENYIETFALYMILCDERDELVKYLNSKKIEVKIHYPLPLHLQKASSNLGYKAGDFPIAEEQSSKLVTLPVHQYLSENQINFMIENIFAFYG